MMRNYNEVGFDKIFYYDETSPSCLRWKEDIFHSKLKYKIKAKDEQAGVVVERYWKVSYMGKQYPVHRIIFLLLYGDIDQKKNIDHIDGNSLNNHKDNLRAVSQEVNTQNRKKRSNNISGVTVVWLTGEGIGQVWATSWTCFISGKLKTKSFSINKYGYDEAFQLACEYRIEKIKEQNLIGASYTERHGV